MSLTQYLILLLVFVLYVNVCPFLKRQMEPMALGSPASPTSGTGVYANQQQSGAQYLPGFLMGDTSSQVSCN